MFLDAYLDESYDSNFDLIVAGFVASVDQWAKFAEKWKTVLDEHGLQQEGLIIRTFKSRVEQIVYIASAPDKGLCPSYYGNSESIVSVMICGLGLGQQKFDEYGPLSFEDEKARLDNFAIQIKNQSGTVGFIIAYAGRRSRVGEAHARANRAKEYLERRRNIDVGRVVAIDGGYREDSSVEPFVGRTEAAKPDPTPTVQLSDQIIYDNEKPRKRRSVKP